MSISKVLGANPVDEFWRVINDGNDVDRRRRAARKWSLYRDNSEQVLREEFAKIFKSSSRRQRVEAFAWLSTALGFYKRIVNEVSAPVYNPPPSRRMRDAGAQAVLERIMKKVRLNRRMDLITKIGNGTGAGMLHWRHSPRRGLQLDAIIPSQFVVVEDPDEPTAELGVAFSRQRVINGKSHTHWVCWDAEVAFELDDRGKVFAALPEALHPKHLPFVPVHMVERAGSYWEATSSGSDLEAAHTTIGYIVAMMLRLFHAQGHGQPVINGDPANFPAGQILDPENPLFSGMGNTATMLFNPQDPSGGLKTVEMIITAVAANHGVDRERLNANITAQATGIPLLERRAETLQVLHEAEVRSLEVGALVSRESPDPGMRMPMGAELEEIDFPDLSAKIDREKQLRVRKEERRLGYRSVVTDKLEDNPELGGDRVRAKAEIERDMDDEAWYIERRRAKGIDTNASATEPGQSQAENGAMGSAVRDGELSKDDAAEQAKKGPIRKPPAEE